MDALGLREQFGTNVAAVGPSVGTAVGNAITTHLLVMEALPKPNFQVALVTTAGSGVGLSPYRRVGLGGAFPSIQASTTIPNPHGQRTT